MFTNRSSREINIRVVVYGPELAGKMTLLQRIYAAAAEDERGDVISAETETERTVFFDLSKREFPEVDAFRLRLHFYTLTGNIRHAASGKLLLENVDAVVFVADAQAERAAANVAAFSEMTANLQERDLQLEAMPHLIAVAKSDLVDGSPLRDVSEQLDVPVDQLLDLRDPDAAEAVVGRLVSRVEAQLRSGGLREWRPSREEEQSGRESTARSRLVGHYSEHFGEPTGEYDPANPIAGRPRMIVSEHGPREGRPYWTYATCGLSLWAQAPGGPEPRVELLAYSPEEDQRVVDVLMVLARQIHLVEEGDAPFKTFDTVALPGVGLCHENFLLARVAEIDAFLRFPDFPARVDDVRFTHAITGDTETGVEIDFIHVVPVRPEQVDAATREGAEAVLQRLNLAHRGKDSGWSQHNQDKARAPRKKFLGLF